MENTRPGAKAICDASGFEFAHSELVKTWDGFYVHPRFLDRRNPQDFVTGRADRQALPWSRPEAPDVFLTTNQVTPESL